jgi:hypothetical protein
VAKPLPKILDGLYADFEKWVDASREKGPKIEIVWSEDLDRFRDPKKEFKIKWIVVGHNPGKQERGTCNKAGLWIGRYFHPNGATGSWTRLILAHDVRCLGDQVLFLEKTPICSDNLEGLKSKDKHPLFKQMQECMAKAVFGLQESTGAYVWIQGYSTSLDDPFMSFFSQLRGLYVNTAVTEARKNKVFKTYHMVSVMKGGRGFPVEELLGEGLAEALPKVAGFECLK